MTVGRTLQKPFVIAYDDFEDVVIIDGVRCTPEALQMLIVDPKPHLWIQVRRTGDEVCVVTGQLEPIVDRLTEMGFAYERAAGMIESHCTMEEHVEDLENGWYDLGSSNIDLSDEVAYLESRRLIQRHPEHPAWVTIADEGDPYPAGEAVAHG
jgi:hypothetical protein